MNRSPLLSSNSPPTMDDDLPEDILALILARVADARDRKISSEVSRHWYRVEAVSRSSLRILGPDAPFALLLSRFPNLTSIRCSHPIPDADLSLIAGSCRNLLTLDLNARYNPPSSQDFVNVVDFSDTGLNAVASSCRKVNKVGLRWRRSFGDTGVDALARCCRNIVVLDLSFNENVSDEGLKSISRGLASLLVLRVVGCVKLGDNGLLYLASGITAKTVRTLDVSECEAISNQGVCHLCLLSCLEELNLRNCLAVSDDGVIAVAQNGMITKLNLSWLTDLTDKALLAVASHCKNLLEINITGCNLVTGAGFRAFQGHPSLEVLLATTSYNNISRDDIAQTVFSCSRLRQVGLNRSVQRRLGVSLIDKISQCGVALLLH